ncbi:hypothetical protein ACW95P_02965 [Candidatus Mycoplasma pogonae]
MNIEQRLKAQFSEINKVFFEKELGQDFLRIEVNLTSMDAVESVTRLISDFLDQNYETDKQYFLDVYSHGSSPQFSFTEAHKFLERKILVTLYTKIDQQQQLVGVLKSVTANELSLVLNYKGRLKIYSIPITNIQNLEIYTDL